MPSRKHRRRREKSRRHEYEYVYVDGEGREVEVDEEEEAGAEESRGWKRSATAASGSAGKSGGKRAVTTAGGRKMEPPTWRRAIRRGLIFGPFMFLTIYLLDRGVGLASQLLFTAQMLLLFIPFTYLMDRMMYRRFTKQAESRGSPQPSRKR